MTTHRPRLTMHQSDVLRALSTISIRMRRAGGEGWVPATYLGSRGALTHLVAKGFVEQRMGRPGPRGGERPEYRPLAAR